MLGRNDLDANLIRDGRYQGAQMKWLILCLLIACGPMTPEERGIEVTDKIGIFNQSKALFWTQTLTEDEYGVDLGDLSTSAVIYWADTRCPKNGQYAVIYKGQCNYGRMWSCDEIYVALSGIDSDRTCGSALLHEFGHCLSMSMGLGGDHSHSDARLWAVIETAKRYACDRGW